LEPIHWSEAVDLWVLTTYDDCQAILKHPHFGRGDGWRINPPGDEPLMPVEVFRSELMLLRDPPEHRRLRQLVQKAFTPTVINNLRPIIYDIMDELLREYENKHEINLVEAIAYPLPIMVISAMLGVPKEDWSIIRRYSKDIGGIFEAIRTQAHIDAGNRLAIEMRAYFDELFAYKKENPADDLITNLIKVKENDAENYTMGELISNSILLLFAGHETTSNLISNGVFDLLSHPEQFERLKNNKNLMPSTVIEVLRYRTSLPFNYRTALEDVEYKDMVFKKGQWVLTSLTTANRDPQYYTDPDVFDIERDEAVPLSFGQGIHYCLGAPLAKLETEIALEKLIEKMPNMKLKNLEPNWIPYIAFRGHTDLWLQF